ncbi:ATP-dependent Clp protease proteolytic subunit [Cardinium endosymbiont of Philonthus spinipes]|uniref:ATP-dependent Clp protease proteolytic subunit n=1 Tax=Cardinium endosymbiont of Philonthus spinipes TaxID=3077941 RepID=UPI00313B09BE
MLGLYHIRRAIRVGFPCFTLLTAAHVGLAKQEKNKQTAVVAPTIQKVVPDVDKANIANKNKLQSDLEAENALNRARLEKQLSTIIAQIEQLRLEKERQRLDKEIEDENVRREHDKEMRLLNMKREKLAIKLELAKVKLMMQMEQYDSQLLKIGKKIELEKGETQLLQEAAHRLQAEMETLQAQAARDKHIQKKPIYLKDPLIKKSNTLVLSDRCIDLNGAITPWKANYIVDQIHYFNNKSNEYPIFLVIGDSPGGYISAGWNILQAIEHSKAPVYVVVKTCAASMAAMITTLATKSYAYPNAKILHHQPFSCVWGNLRETKEHYEQLNEIWKRLGSRVAKKMGISLAAFDKKLYEKSMYGDWMEYGNKAKKLKWVDYVIDGIQNSAVSSLPEAVNYTFEQFIKHHYGFDAGKGKEQSSEEEYYQALAPHDFDYRHRPGRKDQIVTK